MNPNYLYQKTFEARELEAFRQQRITARKAAQAEWNDAIAAEQKRLAPPKKGRKKQPEVKLPDEFLDNLRAELFAKHKIEWFDEELKRLEDERTTKLNELADAVILGKHTEMVKLDSSNTSSFRSQGYGMHKYAKGVLIPMQEKLNALGYTTEIRFKLWFKGEGRWNCGDTGDYELWANCLPWMYDAIERRTTYQEVLLSRKKFGVNNLVYNPFLSEAAALAQF